jgi:uncharacterized repeat protein (TIGR01451 family)
MLTSAPRTLTLLARRRSFFTELSRTRTLALFAAVAILAACALLRLAPASRARVAHNISSGTSARNTARAEARSADGDDATRRAATDALRAAAYGRLPLSFVANDGQLDARVKFAARGDGYQLFLTPSEAVLALSRRAPRADDDETTASTRAAWKVATDASANSHLRAARAVLRVKLIGAGSNARLSGEESLPGRVNFLIGDDPSKWRTGVESFAGVRYDEVYPGIALVYYGNQRQLEYDFRLAPHADPRRVRIRFGGARALTTDAQGQLLVRFAGGYVVQHKPDAYQIVGGARREVSCRYVVVGRHDVRFALGKYDRAQPLVIDPVLIYSTFLGGSGTDQANGVAVDAGGNAYIVGQTFSTNFPVANAIQGTLSANNSTDAFVVKLNPAGTALLYSTYLGGAANDTGYGVAVDANGNAYVTGTTASADFPHTGGAMQPAKSGNFDAFIAKLSASGSSLVYSTFLGGVNSETGYGVGVDAAGNAYVVGAAASPSINGIALPKRGSPAYKSADAGASWSAIKDGTTDTAFNSITVDPTNGSTLYAAGSVVFKSTNGGSTWSATPPLVFSPTFNATPRMVAVDPNSPATLYAATSLGLYKSTDGGGSWAESDNGIGGSAFSVYTVLVDPSNHTTLYAGTLRGVYKSTDGGANWTAANTGLSFSPPQVSKLAFDPTNSATIYAATSRGVFKSSNAAGSWTGINNGFGFLSGTPIVSLVVDPGTPATLYAASAYNGVYKTTDGGANWAASGNGLSITTDGITYETGTNAIAINPLAPATLYVATNLGVFKTTDGGANWSPSNGGLANLNVNDVVVERTTPANVYAATSSGSEAFAAKLNSSGTTLGYLLYLGGDENDYARGVAVDAAGNAYIAGVTNSINFPVANAAQASYGGGGDAFVTKLASGGSVVYSTYLGGNNTDEAAAIAVDSSGRAYVTGDTYSSDFPTTATLKPHDPYYLDAFVTRLSPAGSSLDYSLIYGGSADDQGFGIAADAAGNAYVTGATYSNDLPLQNAVQASAGGGADAFVLKLGAAGAVSYSTYLGGYGQDQGLAITADTGGAVYVAGVTGSPNFPATPASPQGALGGGYDAFIAKLQPGIDLALTMSATPDPVPFGGNLTYTINVVNRGELTATNVRLTDALPAGSTLVSANATQGTCAGAVICDLGSLAGSAQATVTVTIKPPAVRNISNTASVAASETEYITSNNTATQSTVVDFADLAVTGATLNSRVAPGGQISYLFTIANNGGTSSGSVTLSDNLPSETAYVSCSATGGGVCGGTGNSRTVTFTSFPVGRTESVLLTARVNGSVAEDSIINNTATVAAALPDPNPADNTATPPATIASTLIKPKQNGKIAFASDRAFTPVSEPSGIYTVNADGTGEALFPNIPLDAHAPAWSPDGTKLAYRITTYNVSGNAIPQLQVINADGSGAKTLASDISDLNSHIAWSPDGQRLAFVATDGVRVVGVDGAGLAKLPGFPAGVNDLDWSPDGTRFAYTKGNDVYSSALDGTGEVNLSNDPSANDHTPRWSPDGTRLLFVKTTNNADDIYFVNADGSGASRLLNIYRTTDPAWSPDGTKLAYQSLNQLYAINFDGSGTATRLTNNTYYNFTPDWQPLPGGTPPPTPTPVVNYSISGRLTNRLNGNTLFGQVMLSGTRSGLIQTDEQGRYTLVNLPAGGTYTVTPIYDGFSFQPASRTFDNLAANQTADFAGDYVPINISGRVIDTTGAPLANVKITSYGGYPEGSTFTDANGNYAFPNVLRHRGYSITPTPFGAYTFQPDTIYLENLNQSATVNFVGTKQPSNTISGRVTTDDATPVGVGGASVILARDNAVAAQVFTDGNGNYDFGEVQAGHDYSVSIFPVGFYAFIPSPYVFKNLNRDARADFVRRSYTSNRQISGYIRDANGNGVGGVTVLLGGASNSATGTNTDGSYSFINVPGGFNYTVTPVDATHAFSPAHADFAPLSSNGVANFTASVAPVMQFGALNYTVSEGAGRATLTVTRSGDTSVASSISYMTQDDPAPVRCDQRGRVAFARCDYATTVDTVIFQPGETSKSISIPVIEDAHVEDVESFQVMLFNPVGGVIGFNQIANVNITDNDMPDEPNPINSIPLFVRMQYLDFLSREPEPQEPWSGLLGSCPDPFNLFPGTPSANCDRVTVSANFFLSDEFKLKGFYAFTFYKVSFGRLPSYDEIVTDMRSVTGQTSTEVFQKRAQFADSWVRRQEFKNLYDSLDNAAFVSALMDRYKLQQITTPDPANPDGTQKVTLTRADLVNRLGGAGGALTRAQVLRAVVQSDEVGTVEFNSAFVSMQYYGYLRRAPEPGGYNDWVTYLTAHPGDFRGMVYGFINASEYKLRFGQP